MTRTSPKKKRRVTLMLPAEVTDRTEFLRRKLDLLDVEEVMIRGQRVLDIVVCGVMIEGATLVLEHRDGRREVVAKP